MKNGEKLDEGYLHNSKELGARGFFSSCGYPLQAHNDKADVADRICPQRIWLHHRDRFSDKLETQAGVAKSLKDPQWTGPS